MYELNITQIGNSCGIILPKEMLAVLDVEKGNTLFATKTQNGFEISPYDPAFHKQMEAAKRIMREDRDILKKLAE